MPHAQTTTQHREPTDSPFHAGEQAVQRRLGVRDTIEPWARQVVRPYLPEEHRQFYRELPFIIAAARDREGRPWASLLTGQAGFIHSPDPQRLRLASQALPGDALAGALTTGGTLGLLGIELETQRRNRVNGTLSDVRHNKLEIEVSQSFGNCPQYITQRAWRHVEINPADASVTHHQHLTRQMKQWIGAADTLFIASGYDGDRPDDTTHGMDASHRGGTPGFVDVTSDTQLVLPDYSGNNHFNTLGNLVMDPRVGLLFVDFEHGRLLQISGIATIEWDSAELKHRPGALRQVRVDIEHIVLLEHVLSLRWSEAQARQSLHLVKKVKESSDVTSFVFAAADGRQLPPFKAGQHLPISVPIDAHGETFTRTYSLSNHPGDGFYRISVKRQAKGLVSRYLHDVLQPGACIEAGRPHGDFTIQDHQRPIALISAGIGITPMLSLLADLAATAGARPVYFIHSARDGAHHPFAQQVRRIDRDGDKVHVTVFYSQPRRQDIEGVDYDRPGRIGAESMNTLVPELDADFYLCGPPGFVAGLGTALKAQGVNTDRVHFETF